MLLIAIALNLLVVSAGTTLMSRTQSEVTGRFYKFISRFIILMGLLGVLFAGCIAMQHFCGYHKKSHCRINIPQCHTISANRKDSIKCMNHHAMKCCPQVYCSAHISDYGEESIIYPKNCVCCSDKNQFDSADSLQ